MEAWMKTIVDAVKDDALVLLTGAGASMNPPRPMPSWPGFVKLLAEDARRFQAARAELILAELAEGNLLGAAELYAQDNRIPQADRAAFFRATFDTKESEVPEVYRELGSLPARHWLTTNFDNHLKHAFSDKEGEIVDQRELANVLSLWNEKRFGVYLHGRAHKYETLVYRTTTYDAVEKLEPYREFLKRVFLQSTVFAYGYSFSDPDLLAILRFVAERLGGCSQRSHVIFAPEGTALPAVLGQANFKPVYYDPDGGHARARDLLRELRKSVGTTKPLQAPSSVNPSGVGLIRSLVGLCTSLMSQSTSTYDSACAALAVSGMPADGSWVPRFEIARSVSMSAHVSISEAETMVDAGLKSATLAPSIESKANKVRLKQPVTAAQDLEPLVDAIETRYATYASDVSRNRKRRREIIQEAVTYVMIAQGMAMAKSFVDQEPASAYAIQVLVGESLASKGLLDNERANLSRSLVEIMAQPPAELSCLLFRLAHSAYALESVFLNPLGNDVGKLLDWRIYLDSNVVMRTLAPTTKQSAGLRSLFRRLTVLHTPLIVLGPFVEEIIDHSRLLETSLQSARVNSVESLRKHVESLPERERSPLITWYLARCVDQGWRPVGKFLSESELASTDAIARALGRHGIEVEGDDAVRKFDTSTRETLWDDLRKWRGTQQSPGARRLRRNEATQIEWLVDLRRKGIRGWFLSVDGQLRQALKFIEGGKYAGYVVTPTAWAHRMADLHWGEVDLAGFAEMMWSLPERTPSERLQQMATRRLFEADVDMSSINLERLRDRVESLLETKRFDVMVDQAADPEAALQDIANQVIPKAVEQLLDEIARGQLRRS